MKGIRTPFSLTDWFDIKLNLDNCCQLPDIYLEESLIDYVRVIKCRNCSQFLHVTPNAIDIYPAEIWNNILNKKETSRAYP